MTRRVWRTPRVIPKEARTIPLPGNEDRGNGLDDDRYFSCWHCGFTCDSDRDSLGGFGDGVSYSDAIIESVPTVGDPLTSVSVLGNPHYQVALELGMDGNPKEIRHEIIPVVNNGCPLCGTLNWRETRRSRK